MSVPYLLDHLVSHAAERDPARPALVYGGQALSYAELGEAMQHFANGVVALGTGRGERVGIWLEKRFETVVATFGTAAAGCVFVPLNPLLRPTQVAYILRDCNVRVLVTSAERLALLEDVIAECKDLRHIVVTSGDAPDKRPLPVHAWASLLDAAPHAAHRVIDTDVLAILYTSGSTGNPKGVVLSHRNMVAGATSVASYLRNCVDDTILAALPLSFDAGFSQLTTGFHAGARVVLLNYLVPKDVLNAVVANRVTGLTAVPPLWIQLSQLTWPAQAAQHVRYIANTGGRMPEETLRALRKQLPSTQPFLMYGLTEAFRSTYLPPDEVDRRPDSIGKAIPNAEILVLRDDGTPCDVDEPGELVHRGALVGLGYWNDAAKTAERYKPLPGREAGLVMPEIAVFSGDTVRKDAEGFLYFIGRRDEMIKTSGYRVSPTEIEEVLYATRKIGECAAFGVDHPVLGQAIAVVVTAADGERVDVAELVTHCRNRLPAYMLPSTIHVREGSLPRNPNGKIDRKAIAADLAASGEGRAP
jgi:acyl-CoA ligase (AMP-forming) (exosortase A-associated)